MGGISIRKTKRTVSLWPLFRGGFAEKISVRRERSDGKSRELAAAFLISCPEPGVRGRRRAPRLFDTADTHEAQPSRRAFRFVPRSKTTRWKRDLRPYELVRVLRLTETKARK